MVMSLLQIQELHIYKVLYSLENVLVFQSLKNTSVQFPIGK